MLLTKEVKLKWNGKIKQHYVDLGYVFTKMKEEFIVKVEDLTDGSNVKIKVLCDYCNEEYELTWYTYTHRTDKETDCCGNPSCTGKKASESLYKKYGVYNCRKIEDVNQKIKNTCLKRYGVENPFQAKEIKEKIIEYNLKNYGVEHQSQREDVKIRKSKSIKKHYEEHPNELIKEKSPRWKGGVAHSRVERATYEYNNWRKEVFKRDNYTCQCCNKRGGIKINAHHIKNWKDNVKERYDIDNGITLCEKCHNEFHSKYGKSFNTKEQLKKFLDEKIC